jgi:hypothetical protein
MKEVLWGESHVWNGCADLALLESMVTATQHPGVTDAMIRCGLIEEIDEILHPEKPLGESPEALRLKFAKEVGDGMWYGMATAGSLGLGCAVIVHHPGVTLDSFQANFTSPQLPIINHHGETLAEDDTSSSLVICALRVVDTMNAQTPGLWIGTSKEDRANKKLIIRDYFVALGAYAAQHDVKLSEAAGLTALKLATRTRKPHVVEDAAILSGRERLTAQTPWVRDLLLGTIRGQLDVLHETPAIRTM